MYQFQNKIQKETISFPIFPLTPLSLEGLT